MCVIMVAVLVAILLGGYTGGYTVLVAILVAILHLAILLEPRRSLKRCHAEISATIAPEATPRLDAFNSALKSGVYILLNNSLRPGACAALNHSRCGRVRQLFDAEGSARHEGSVMLHAQGLSMPERALALVSPLHRQALMLHGGAPECCTKDGKA